MKKTLEASLASLPGGLAASELLIKLGHLESEWIDAEETIEAVRRENDTLSKDAKKFKELSDEYNKTIAKQETFLTTKDGQISLLQQQVDRLQAQLDQCMVNPKATSRPGATPCKFKFSTAQGVRLRPGVSCMHPNSLKNIGILV